MVEKIRIAAQDFKEKCYQLLNSQFELQLISLTLLVLFITGFRPMYWWGNQSGFGVEFIDPVQSAYAMTEPGFLDHFSGVRTAGLEEITSTNEAGETVTILKPKERTETIQYAVRSGDNISNIAHRFGLKVRTILWANKDITNSKNIEIGTELRIPIRDGVYYEVQRGDTLTEIAELHGTTTDQIVSLNKITPNQVLKVDQEIFVPGAEKIYVARKPDPEPEAPAATPNTPTPTRTVAAVSRPTTNRSNGNTRPSNARDVGSSISGLGYKLRRPTKGTLTQGYHRGHTALDIASSMNTPIYAAAPGEVIVSQAGWNGGYGNYIIIDHGGGVNTLYAHNNVRKVAVGDWVEAGELVALMGNTGRVFGRTGIHLHFELRINGRKVNPQGYFQ